jgi:hypothetical protein
MTKAINILFRTGRNGLFAFAALTGAMLLASVGNAQQVTVFQAAGPNAASIQGTFDSFRSALGGGNNLNAAGPITGGRREINWDGGGSTATAVGATPFDVFLNTRGNRSTTPGTGFVQATPAGLADLFGNPSYSTIFKAFSPSRLFSAIDSNVTETSFFVPGHGDSEPATTRGFGVVFTDVDLPDGSGPGTKRGNRHSSTLVEFFAADGSLIYSGFAAASPGDGNLSFLGIVLDNPNIARVRITSGGAIPGEDDSLDAVVMDDFIYGEPVALPLLAVDTK